MAVSLKLVLFIDAQNVYHRARATFSPGTTNHIDGQIDSWAAGLEQPATAASVGAGGVEREVVRASRRRHGVDNGEETSTAADIAESGAPHAGC